MSNSNTSSEPNWIPGTIQHPARVNYFNPGDGLYVIQTWYLEPGKQYQRIVTSDGINRSVSATITGFGWYSEMTHTIATEEWPQFKRL